jgi:hypothetical protein
MSPDSMPDEKLGTLKIGDKEFFVSDLSDDCKRLVLAIKDSDEQALRLKRQLNYIEIARRTLVRELIGLLPETPTSPD